MGKQGRQSHRSGDCSYLKIKEGHTTLTSWKIGKLNGQYPKVVLCDAANNGVTLSKDCSYNFSYVFRTKVIQCCRRKMRAIYRFEPGCLRDNSHQNENEAAAKNRECCPSVRSKRSICPSWRGSERQRHLSECTDAQMLPRRSTCAFPQELMSEGSAACPPFSSAGEQSHLVGGCGVDMGGRFVGGDFGAGFPLARPGYFTEKRLKRFAQSSPPNLENTATAGSGCGDGEETCSWVSDESQSFAESALGNSKALWSAGNKKLLNSSEAETLSEVSAQDVTGEMDQPASLTCQRVQVYVRKSVFSCARTDKPWPFSGRLQNTQLHAVKPACPAEIIDPPDNSEFLQNRNEPFTNSANDSLSDATKCIVSKVDPHDLQQNNGKQAGRREEASEKQSNGKNHDHSTNLEHLAPHSVSTERSQAGPDSDGTHLSPIAASTRAPSVPGLNKWGSATTLSPLSSSSTVPALSSRQKEPPSVGSAEASFPSCIVQHPFHCEKSHRTGAAPFSPSQSTDSRELHESVLLIVQDTSAHRTELTDLSESLPCINRTRVQPHRTKDKLSEFTLPPILSPISSPRVASKEGPLSPRQGSSDEQEQMQKSTCSHSKLNICDESKVANLRCGTSTSEGQEVIPRLKPVALRLTRSVSPRESDRDAKPSQSETSEEDTPHRQDDDASCSEGEMEQSNVKTEAVLDEFSAFEQDILLLDVTQDDPELFENVPQGSLINLGPTRSQETTRTARPLPGLEGTSSSALVQRFVLRCGTSLMHRVFPR